jgi:hypothetical protein
MGVDLSSLKNDRDAWFNWSAWRFLLDTAKRFGWEPMGTVFEDQIPLRKKGNLSDIEKQRIRKRVEAQDENLDGSYYSNDDQIVPDPDAANLLQALTRSINNRNFLASIEEDSFEVIKDFMGFLKNGAFRIS